MVEAVLIGEPGDSQVRSIYPLPVPAPADFRIFASVLLTDGLFLCATRNASEALQVAQPFRRSPTFHYQYSHMLSWAPVAWGPNFTECSSYVCHGSDLPMWWEPQLSPGPGFGNYTASEVSFARSLHWYWANFAATGSPGNGDPTNPTITWPAYNAASRSTLNLDTVENGGFTVIPSLRASFCAWWDNVVGYNVY